MVLLPVDLCEVTATTRADLRSTRTRWHSRWYHHSRVSQQEQSGWARSIHYYAQSWGQIAAITMADMVIKLLSIFLQFLAQPSICASSCHPNPPPKPKLPLSRLIARTLILEGWACRLPQPGSLELLPNVLLNRLSSPNTFCHPPPPPSLSPRPHRPCSSSTTSRLASASGPSCLRDRHSRRSLSD